MTETRAVRFHRSSAPYEAGDVAGFPPARAQDLVDRGIAVFHLPVVDGSAPVPAVMQAESVSTPDLLDGMDRAALIEFAKARLGIADDPAPDVTDDALREAIRVNVDPALLQLQAAAQDAVAKTIKASKARA